MLRGTMAFPPIIEGSEKHIAQSLLRVFNTLALCSAIAGEFAMYIPGKMVSRLFQSLYRVFHDFRAKLQEVIP